MIGYGYTSNFISVARQEHFLMGFRFGLKEGFKNLKPSGGPCDSFDKIKIIQKFDYTNKPLSAVRVANELIDENVLFLAGFSSSHEAILAANIAMKNEMAILLAGGAASQLARFGNYSYSTSAGRIVYSKAYIGYFEKHYQNKKVVIIAKKDNVFSEDTLKDLKSNQKSVQLIPVYLDEDYKISKSVLNKIQKQDIAAVFLTMYATESKPSFLQLIEVFDDKIDYFVSSAWMSVDRSLLQDIPIKYKKKMLIFNSSKWDYASQKQTPFYKSFFKEFNKGPEPESDSGYYLGVVASKILNEVQTKSKQAILKELRKLGCLKSPDGEKICRDPKTGFDLGTLYLCHWKEGGFTCTN